VTATQTLLVGAAVAFLAGRAARAERVKPLFAEALPDIAREAFTAFFEKRLPNFRREGSK